jgi:hypothetical protein
MALFKEITNENGITAKYHKISSVLVNNTQIIFYISSYASKEYRDNDADPVLTSMHRFNMTLEEEESMGIRQLCYFKLKQKAEWSDAEDC